MLSLSKRRCHSRMLSITPAVLCGACDVVSPARGAEAGLNHEDGLRVMWIVPREPPVLDNGAAPAVVVIAADDFPDEVIIAAHERLAYEPVEPDGVVLLDRAPLLRRDIIQRRSRPEDEDGVARARCPELSFIVTAVGGALATEREPC